jgi:hypothetical protein
VRALLKGSCLSQGWIFKGKRHQWCGNCLGGRHFFYSKGVLDTLRFSLRKIGFVVWFIFGGWLMKLHLDRELIAYKA